MLRTFALVGAVLVGAGLLHASTTTATGIDGQALRRPLQGIVPVNPPEPLPVAGVKLVARDAGSNKEVAHTTSAKDGSYHFDLPPGKYKLEAKFGALWHYTQTVEVPAKNRLALKSFFRYTGNSFPPSAPPARASNPTAFVEIDVEGKLPAKLELKNGDTVDFTKVFPGSLKMVYVETNDDKVLEPQWVPLTTPQTPLPTKVVVRRFKALKTGTCTVTVTFEDNSGKQTTKDIEVTVK